MAKQKRDIGMAKEPPAPKSNISLYDQGYIQVTEANRKNAVIIGRIFYYIRSVGLKHQITMFFSIPPLLKKGWNKIPTFPWDATHPYINGNTHWNCFYDEDADYEHWKNIHKWIIDKGIHEKILYIKSGDPILTYLNHQGIDYTKLPKQVSRA